VGLVIPLVACLSVGYFWNRFGTFQLEFCTTLVLRVGTPTLIFHTLSTVSLDNSALARIASVSLIALLICALMAATLLAVIRAPIKDLLLAAVFPNSGNFGLPMAYLAFGERGFAIAVIFFTCCAIVQHTLGSLYLHQRGSWIRILTLPPLVAVVAAVALRSLNVTVPEPVLESTRMLGSLTVPIMLLVLGHALANMPRSSLPGGTLIASMRLGLGLISGLAVTQLFQLENEVAMVIILQMSMPVAVISYVYARPLGVAVSDTVAGGVLVSTVAAVVTLPLLVWWLQSV